MQHFYVAVAVIFAFVFVIKGHATGGQYCFIGTNNLDTILGSNTDIKADVLINLSNVDDISVQEKLRQLMVLGQGRVSFGLILTPSILSPLRDLSDFDFKRQICRLKLKFSSTIGFRARSVGIFRADCKISQRFFYAGVRRFLVVEDCFDSDNVQELAAHFPVLNTVTTNEGENPELAGTAVTSNEEENPELPGADFDVSKFVDDYVRNNELVVESTSGLTISEIASLPSEAPTAEECPVCSFSLMRHVINFKGCVVPGDRCRPHNCQHTFHRACLIPWLIKKRTCPMCKHPVLAGELAPLNLPIEQPLSLEELSYWEREYSYQLQALEVIGFHDTRRNIQALIAAGGDIDEAVAFLVGDV